MARDILVLVEHWEGKVESITSQLLAFGFRAAERMGVNLIAAAIGHGLDGVLETLEHNGVDSIVLVDDPALQLPDAELQAEVISEVVRQTNPGLILIGYSLAGMELAPAIATKLGVTALTNCVNVEFLNGALTVTRPVFNGTAHAKIALEENETVVVAVQKGMAPAIQRVAKQPDVRRLTVDVKSLPSRIKVLGVIEEEKGDVDISKAEIVVSVGRGIGDKEKIHVMEELAEALGGVLACSRPVVDVGWLPRERQVGASGKNVAPKIYVACGISGAIQHLSGMRESKRIIAINKDPNAPIFQVAHFGVVGDLFEIVPALAKAAKEVKGD
jgi:electron transfer flavoprotein alpha subunit